MTHFGRNTFAFLALLFGHDVVQGAKDPRYFYCNNGAANEVPHYTYCDEERVPTSCYEDFKCDERVGTAIVEMLSFECYGSEWTSTDQMKELALRLEYGIYDERIDVKPVRNYDVGFIAVPLQRTHTTEISGGNPQFVGTLNQLSLPISQDHSFRQYATWYPLQKPDQLTENTYPYVYCRCSMHGHYVTEV